MQLSRKRFGRNRPIDLQGPSVQKNPALFRGQTVGSVRACDGGRPQVLPRDTGDQDRWCDRARFPLPRHVGCCAGPVPPLPRDRYASSTTLRSSRTCVNRSVQRIGVISARIDFCRWKQWEEVACWVVSCLYWSNLFLRNTLRYLSL
jgi:hypothetical protein